MGAIDLPLPSATGVAFPVPSGINPAAPDTFTGIPLGPPAAPLIDPGLVADHLVYAYLVESTGVFEVMAEVVRRLSVGETLNPISPAAHRWVRTTEELFFRDPPLYSIQGVLSELRPDQRVNRRNAYWRMFGLEPPHPVPARWLRPGVADGSWKQDVGDGVNSSFREKWTELLRQVWLGIENANNGIGPNATDKEYIAFLCDALRDMMALRRRGGLLAREEFAYVSTLSWFHLTLEDNFPIVADLNAQAPGPAERLEKLAARVGMTPAARSRELFELADLMSGLLRAIELSVFSSGTCGRAALPQPRHQHDAADRHEPDHRPVAVGHRRPRQGPAVRLGPTAPAAVAGRPRGAAAHRRTGPAPRAVRAHGRARRAERPRLGAPWARRSSTPRSPFWSTRSCCRTSGSG